VKRRDRFLIVVLTAAAVAAMWNHALIMEEVAQPQKIAWPQFRPDEIADLVAYLQELRGSR